MGSYDDLKRLFEETSGIIESPENKRRLEMWPLHFKPSAYEPGLIPPLDPALREEKRPPLSADWDRINWSRLLGFDIERYFKEPRYYLKWTLKINLFRFRNFPDDTPLTYTIPIFLSVAMEPSLFGVPVLYSTEHEPLFTSEGAVVREWKDLSKIDVPDFYRSGLMPLAHRFYEELREIAPGEWRVEFPVWLRGPFGVACWIRSMQKLLIDLIENPSMVHELMDLIVESRKDYTNRRRRVMGEDDIEHGCADNSMANDEVCVPIVSPRLCEEFILPYEKTLEEFHGGIHWWHSCGNKTPLVKAIQRTFNSVDFMDFALWSDDLFTAVRNLNDGIPFHVRPHAGDILERNEDIVRNTLAGIYTICRGRNFALRVDGLQPPEPTRDHVTAMQRYLSVARRLGEEYCEYWAANL